MSIPVSSSTTKVLGGSFRHDLGHYGNSGMLDSEVLDQFHFGSFGVGGGCRDGRRMVVLGWQGSLWHWRGYLGIIPPVVLKVGVWDSKVVVEVWVVECTRSVLDQVSRLAKWLVQPR